MFFFVPRRILAAASLLSSTGVFSDFSVLESIFGTQSNTHSFGDVRTDLPIDSFAGPIDFEAMTMPLSTVPDAAHLKSSAQTLFADATNEYECIMPPSAGSIHGNLEPPAILEEAQRRAQLLGRDCLRMQTSNWEYEFCPMRHLRQIYRDPSASNAQITGVQRINIGGLELLVPIANGQNAGLASLLPKVTNEVIYEHLMGRYIPNEGNERIVNGHLVQSFIDGDICGGDATEEQRWIAANTPEGGGPEVARQTDVHFECSSVEGGDRILSVSEVSFCKYVLRIGSPKFCASHADGSNAPRVIKCYPTHPVSPTSNKPLSQPESEPSWISRLRRMAKAKNIDVTIKHTTSGDPAADEAAGAQIFKQWMTLFGLKPEDDPLFVPEPTDQQSDASGESQHKIADTSKAAHLDEDAHKKKSDATGH